MLVTLALEQLTALEVLGVTRLEATEPEQMDVPPALLQVQQQAPKWRVAN